MRRWNGKQMKRGEREERRERGEREEVVMLCYVMYTHTLTLTLTPNNGNPTQPYCCSVHDVVVR